MTHNHADAIATAGFAGFLCSVCSVLTDRLGRGLSAEYGNRFGGILDMVRAISSSVARARYYAGLSLIFWQPEWLAERQVWHSGEIVQAFGGNGVVVCSYVGGALLLERAMPGESLVNLAVSGRDDEAATIMAAVIHRMAGRTPPPRCPTLHD